MRYQYACTGIVRNKKTANTKSRQEYGGSWTLRYG